MSIWNNIKNVVSASTDIIIIGSKEINYQLTKASDASESVTDKLAERTATLRAKHQANLAARKSGIVKNMPSKITTIN